MDKCFYLLQVCQVYGEPGCLWSIQENDPDATGGKITSAAINHVAIIKLFSKWNFSDAVSFILSGYAISYNIASSLFSLFILEERLFTRITLLYCPEISAMINTLPWIVHHIFPLGHWVQCPFMHLSVLTNRFTYIVFTEGHIFRCLLSAHIIRLDCSG